MRRPRWVTPDEPAATSEEMVRAAAAISGRAIRFRSASCTRTVCWSDLVAASADAMSMSDPVPGCDGMTYEDAHAVPATAERRAADRDLVSRALAVLLPRERAVVIMHYVLGMTLAEVGERLGISGERARQIRNAAIDEMRAALLTA